MALATVSISRPIILAAKLSPDMVSVVVPALSARCRIFTSHSAVLSMPTANAAAATLIMPSAAVPMMLKERSTCLAVSKERFLTRSSSVTNEAVFAFKFMMSSPMVGMLFLSRCAGQSLHQRRFEFDFGGRGRFDGFRLVRIRRLLVGFLWRQSDYVEVFGGILCPFNGRHPLRFFRGRRRRRRLGKER